MLIFTPAVAKELTVCEVLANLSHLRGKKIEVRGVWTATDHGATLSPSQNDGCPQKLRSKSIVWPEGIVLVQEQGANLMSMAWFEMVLKQKQPKKGDVVVVTFTGVLEARWPLEAAYSRDGKLHPYGFGHLNTMPAQLRFTDIKRPLVRKSGQQVKTRKSP
ncbi:MAG: hypothetical protein ACRD7E_25400 [Bryobacteraceae bacterium]